MNPELDLGRRALRHLEQVVAIDSASDERSSSVPTTPGQTVLADHLAGFFSDLGATVARDDFANIIARFPGVGRGIGQPPVALMVHLDTAPGTVAVPGLHVVPRWAGDRVPYPANPRLHVDIANYPVLKMFAGHHLVHGPGDAPFGLDDKLGLTHLMTLAHLMATEPDVERPPVLLIGRPDEEVGRDAALHSLARTLAAEGVELAYTVDGLLPYEVNVENFNAAAATIWIPDRPLATPTKDWIALHIGGVNTHGATAKAEGHRPATRLLAEVVTTLQAQGFGPDRLAPVHFECVVERDCDGTAIFAVADAGARVALEAITEAVIGPHIPRGAAYAFASASPPAVPTPGALQDALRFIQDFLRTDDGIHPIAAEDSDGRQGYSQPHRITPGEGGLDLSVRLRDFEPAALEARKAQVIARAPDGSRARVVDQYTNMGPRLAHRPELVSDALAAGRAIGVTPEPLPIRGGTGVDPFLDLGVPVANLGTGYFAPESEKELTSLETMAGHARWLQALLRTIAERRA